MVLGSGIRDPRSGIWKKPIPDPGSRGQKAPDPKSGSATLETSFTFKSNQRNSEAGTKICLKKEEKQTEFSHLSYSTTSQ